MTSISSVLQAAPGCPGTYGLFSGLGGLVEEEGDEDCCVVGSVGGFRVDKEPAKVDKNV